MGHYYDCPECGQEKHGSNSTCSRSPWKKEESKSVEYYELHITMLGITLPPQGPTAHIETSGMDVKYVQEQVEKLGWTYSRIDGDPVEGPGVKHYATRHLKSNFDRQEVLFLLNTAADKLREAGVNVTRKKIELVIHDSSSSKVRV